MLDIYKITQLQEENKCAMKLFIVIIAMFYHGSDLEESIDKPADCPTTWRAESLEEA